MIESESVDLYDENGCRVSPDGEAHGGQIRMAYRLARAARGRLMHVRGIGWLVYDGTRWVEDLAGAAHREVLAVLRDALAESLGDPSLRPDVAKCESANGINGVLEIASNLVEFAATVSDLDADPFLLNVAQGTLDLRTGQVRPHDPADKLTKVTRGAYDPSADASTWSTFLASVLPDRLEREYLQRVIGQALFGRVREHLLPILIGTGSNGKSTVTTALMFALGDYAAIIDPSLLMAHERGRGASTELMDLMGARLVIGSETEEGRKLDEALMKRLTGGDMLTARRLYRDPVSWVPSHQLVYVSNHLPSVKGNDPAVWRRVRIIPFSVVVPPHERDETLGERLELCADAIVTWAYQGYQSYVNEGMREPETVMRATSEYQAESDDLSLFISEACAVGSNECATTRQLFQAWQSWALRNGGETITERAFGKELDKLGYTARRTRNGALREGISPIDPTFL